MGTNFKKIFIIFTIFALVGCVQSGSKAGRTAITDFTKGGSVGCDEDYFIFSTGNTCISAATGCETGSHLASETEIDTIKSTTDEATLAIINASAGVCVVDVEKIVRPSEVYTDGLICACKDKLPYMVGGLCSSFCAGTTADAATLYVNVSLGPTITANPVLQNLEGWCKNPIPGELNDDGTERVSPGCILKLWDGLSSKELSVVFDSDKAFSANIETMSKGKNYSVQLVEYASGSEAASDFFNVSFKDFEEEDTAESLKLSHVSQYACVTRAGAVTNGESIYNNAALQHYSFRANARPDALAAGNGTNFCHDIITYPSLDNDIYPRLKEIPIFYSLWDYTDSDFALATTGGQPAINAAIKERVTELGGTLDANTFQLLSLPNSPQAQSAAVVGYYMIPWINTDSGRGECPTTSDYTGSNIVYKALGEKLGGTPTEALYISKREAISLDDGSGGFIPTPDDIMFIRESLLNKIWFYYRDGKYYKPDEYTSTSETIRFHYPPDTVFPFQKKTFQKIYTIKSAGDLSGVDVQVGVQPSDKRFGCVPQYLAPTN